MRTVRRFGWMLLGVMCAATSLAQSPTKDKPAPANPPNRSAPAAEFPTFGFSVAIPGQWKRVPETAMGAIARWERGESATGLARAILLIELEPVRDTTLQQHAEALAKAGGGAVSAEKLAVGGKPAVKVQLNARDPQFAQHEIVLCDREQIRYTLELAAVKEEKVSGVLNAVCAGWKWLPIATPTEHLQLRSQPVPLFDGRLRIQMPEIMRVFAPERPDQLKLAIYDVRARALAVVVDIQILANTNALALREVRDEFAKRVQEQFQLKKALAWEEVPGKLPGYLCETVEAPAVENSAPAHVRYGLSQLSKEDLIVWTVTMTGQTPEARKRYAEVVEKLIGSAVGGS